MQNSTTFVLQMVDKQAVIYYTYIIADRQPDSFNTGKNTLMPY